MVCIWIDFDNLKKRMKKLCMQPLKKNNPTSKYILATMS